MRVDGPLVSCLLTAEISLKIIMLLLCVICPTPCTVQHLIYVHMHVPMDPTKINIPTLARNYLVQSTHDNESKAADINYSSATHTCTNQSSPSTHMLVHTCWYTHVGTHHGITP